MTTNSNIAALPSSRSKLIRKLVQRRLLSFYRDKTDLSITFLQAPVLAIAFFFVFQTVITFGAGEIFQPLRNYLTSDTVSIVVFLVVLTAVWFGTSKALVEIPSSMILYQQERLSFLSSFDFILSVFIALSIIVFGQVILFSITFHLIFVVLPAWINPYETGLVIAKSESISFFSALMPGLFIKFVILMWLTALASIAVSMFISTFFKTRSAANAVLPFLLIIQILLGGSIIKPVIGMSPMVHVIADFMVSRWGFEAAALLFEKELNTSMPRYQIEHDGRTEFRAGSFIGTGAFSLKSFDSSTYISVLEKKWDKKSVPEIVNKHPKIANYWYESLFSAIDSIPPNVAKADSNIDSPPPNVAKADSNIDSPPPNVAKADSNIDSLPPNVAKADSKYIEVLTEYYDALDERQNPEQAISVPALLLQHTPSARFLEEAGKKFFGEHDENGSYESYGVYYKAVNQVVRSGTSTNLNEVEQIIWNDVMSTDPRLTYFRPEHSQTTWFILILIIFLTFSLGWLNFERRNR